MNTIHKIRVTSGNTLGYVDVGTGLPIILIHGLFLDHTAFDEQIKAFANRYRIIAIDLHGHGASSELDRSISLDEMAAVPTIIAGGVEDTALPMSASRDIHARIANSMLVEIPQCGHSSSIEQPERVTELLGQLLSQLDR